jgi:hypothetical protein
MSRERATDTSRRLTVSDFENPMFDRQKITLRTIDPHRHVREQMINDYANDLDETDHEAGMAPSHEISRDIAEDMLTDELEPLKGGKYQVIEGVTYTDNFNLVGFTYNLRDSSIQIVNKQNQILYKGFIYTPEEYEKALKKADRKQSKLDEA